MIERLGFDERAALAMRSACGMDADDTFIDRARVMEFWGLYDPEPVGAVAIEIERGRPSIHVGCVNRGRAGRSIKRIVEASMPRYKKMFAVIDDSSQSAVRVARWLGFEPLVRRNGTAVYGRKA